MHSLWRIKIKANVQVAQVRELFNCFLHRGRDAVAYLEDGIEGVFIESPTGRVRLVPSCSGDWSLHITNRPAFSILRFLTDLRTSVDTGPRGFIRIGSELSDLFEAERDVVSALDPPLPAALPISPAQVRILEKLHQLSRPRHRWVPAWKLGCQRSTIAALASLGHIVIDQETSRVRLPDRSELKVQVADPANH